MNRGKQEMRPRFGAASFFAINGWLGFFINEKLEGYESASILQRMNALFTN